MQSFLLLAAISTTSIVATAGCIWLAAHRLGLLKSGAFDAADMRTWTLGFTLFEALIFGLVFSVVVNALGSGEASSAAAGGGVALLMSLGLGQLLRRSRV